MRSGERVCSRECGGGSSNSYVSRSLIDTAFVCKRCRWVASFVHNKGICPHTAVQINSTDTTNLRWCSLVAAA